LVRSPFDAILMKGVGVSKRERERERERRERERKKEKEIERKRERENSFETAKQQSKCYTIILSVSLGARTRPPNLAFKSMYMQDAHKKAISVVELINRLRVNL
jgi:hypothetical protein